MNNVIPQLSLVVVSYNTKMLTLQCLSSLQQLAQQLDPFACEVVLVDNASQDGTVAAVQAQFPTTRIIYNAANLGFAMANNQAIRLCRGHYIGLVNSDAVYLRGDLRTVFEFLEQNPKVALLGPRIEYPNGDIQTSNNAFPDLWTEILHTTRIARLIKDVRLRRFTAQKLHWLVGRVVREYLRVYVQADTSRSVDWVAASVVFFRRALLTQIPTFNEAYPFYFEDSDWCWVLQNQGWRIWYHPSVTFLHWADRAPGKAPHRHWRDLNRQRGKLLYFRRHFDWFTRLMLRIFLLAATGLRLLLFWSTDWREHWALCRLLLSESL